jgi:hypothetical protein
MVSTSKKRLSVRAHYTFGTERKASRALHRCGQIGGTFR